MKTKAVLVGSALVVGGVWIRRHRKNIRMAWNCLTGHSVMYRMRVDLGASVSSLTSRAHLQECIIDGSGLPQPPSTEETLSRCFYCGATDKPFTFDLKDSSGVTVEGQVLKGSICVDCYNQALRGELKL